MILAGTAVRLVLAFTTFGLEYDIHSFAIVRDVLLDRGLDVYGVVNAAEPLRWPYPPAFFPAVLGANWLADLTSLSFHGLIQTPAIAADGILAWLVQSFLGRRGATEPTRLVAVGLIAFGPIFVLISGYHGQIDSLAILPAVAALIVWERGGKARGYSAGGLIGLGVALKIVPGLMLLALLPSARSRREGMALIAAAAAIPAAMLAPFALADPSGVGTIVEYKGGPGMGGLTLALQPGLAERWLTGAPVNLNPAVDLLFEQGVILNLALVAALAVVLIRYRPPAPTAAVIVWLAIWAFGTSFFFQYLVWGLPFLILACHLRTAATIQLLALLPALLFYLGPWSSEGIVYAYVPFMLVLWIFLLRMLIVLVRRAASAAARSPAVLAR